MGSGNSKHIITQHDKAILDLKVQRDKLKQYAKNLDHVMQKEVDIARSCLAQGDKRRALLALKKKKFQQQLVEKTEVQLQTIDELVRTIEFAVVEKDVYERLTSGNEALKKLQKETSLEMVEQLMMDTEDAVAYQHEIDVALAGSISAEDEEEMLRQLDEMEREEMESRLPSVPETAIGLPEAQVPQPERTGAMLAN
jgi:charged multivesicular body protein 6